MVSGEAGMIHRALFPRQPVPADVAARYDAARARFFGDDRYARLVAFLAERELDPEAVEYALRLRHGPNSLTQRFQVKLTLCEVRPAYDAAFVQYLARFVRHRFVGTHTESGGHLALTRIKIAALYDKARHDAAECGRVERTGCGEVEKITN